MKDFGYKLDEVLNLGYFEAHRLWLISDEIRARDLFYMSLANDFTNQSENKRKEFLNWIETRQPRRKPVKMNIPIEVLERFEKAWENG